MVLCITLDEKMKNKYLQKAHVLLDKKNRNTIYDNFKEYLIGNHIANIYTGYRKPDFEKFTEMVIYFAEKTTPFKTKINKLLFYADFLMFKQSCFSISGLKYKAIDMGPVPNNYQSIFEYLTNNNEIEILFTEFPNGYTGEQFKPLKNRNFKAELFSDSELEILDKVATIFKNTSTNEIIELSHLEKAWTMNEKDKNIISYKYAFELSQI